VLSSAEGNNAYAATLSPQVQLNLGSISVAGGNQPHNNLMPFLGLTFIIALQGVFPARS
jgi:microcystin-dependent protein